MATQTKVSTSSTANKVEMAVGIGALAALAAGAYFLYGTKDGAKKRVKIKGWMLKAKGEVMEKLENLKNIDEASYNAIVNTVMKKYENMKDVQKPEVVALFMDIKKHWKNIKKHLGETKKTKPVAKKKLKK
jgi:hypothetical protein